MRDGDVPPSIPVKLQADGLLWAINRQMLHSHGFALAVGPDGQLSLQGDGSEPWMFGSTTDLEQAVAMEALEREKFDAFQAMLSRARTANKLAAGAAPTAGE